MKRIGGQGVQKTDSLLNSPYDVELISAPKKQVCRALVRVLEESHLARTIDPEQLFTLLTQDFHQLYTPDHLDLSPLWDVLASQASSRDLQGLFLAFERRGKTEGLRVSLPNPVETLTVGERAAALARFDRQRKRTRSGSGVVIEAVQALSTIDFEPVVSPDTRRAIVHAAVVAVMSTAAGKSLGRSQLLYLIDENFRRLYGAAGFDFGPIAEEVRKLDGVDEEALYAMRWRLEYELAEYDVPLRPLRLDLSEQAKAQIAERLERALKQERKQSVRKMPREPRLTMPPLASVDEADVASSTEEPSTVARSEQVFGGKFSPSIRVPRWVRYGVLGVALVAMGTTAFVFRPNRPLDASSYPIPLQSARLFEGTFQGVVDGSRWWTLDPAEREQRFAAFEVQLRENGYLMNAQIRDERGQLLVTTGEGNRLKPANFFIYGLADGFIPLEERKRLKAPKELRQMMKHKSP